MMFERWRRDYDYDEMSPALTRFMLILWVIGAALWLLTGFRPR